MVARYLHVVFHRSGDENGGRGREICWRERGYERMRFGVVRGGNEKNSGVPKEIAIPPTTTIPPFVSTDLQSCASVPQGFRASPTDTRQSRFFLFSLSLPPRLLFLRRLRYDDSTPGNCSNAPRPLAHPPHDSMPFPTNRCKSPQVRSTTTCVTYR